MRQCMDAGGEHEYVHCRHCRRLRPSSSEAGGQGGEEGWNLCWEWVKTGWCPRGMSCRWDHPAMGAVAAFGFWGEEGEDGRMLGASWGEPALGEALLRARGLARVATTGEQSVLPWARKSLGPP